MNIAQPIIHTAFDKVSFDLWCEDEWLEFKDKVYFYEHDVLYAFLTFVRPGDICIDAGANIGYHTIYLANLVGKSGSVLSFEPDPRHFKKLQANIALNNLKNVQAFPHGLLNERGYYQFWSVKNGGYSSLIPISNMNPERIDIETFALDDIINPETHIRLIKIDCEGAEEKILHGAEGLLKRGVDCVVVEFNYELLWILSGSDRSIREYMDGLGYDFFVLRRDGSEPFPVPLEMRIEMQGRKPHMFNGMFVKKGLY